MYICIFCNNVLCCTYFANSHIDISIDIFYMYIMYTDENINICIYVNMYIFTYVMYVCMYACMYRCMYV